MYWIKGSKIYILGGEYEFFDNIVYLVLVKILGGLVGVKGIFLFVVFKYCFDVDGNLDVCNDVIFVGFIYKMGYWGMILIVLIFGENGDCYGYLIGELY